MVKKKKLVDDKGVANSPMMYKRNTNKDSQNPFPNITSDESERQALWSPCV